MVESALRKASGWGDGLPPYVRERMEAIGVRPTLRQLAALSGVTAITLHRNFHGERPMQWETAKKLAKALECKLDDLALHPLSPVETSTSICESQP